MPVASLRVARFKWTLIASPSCGLRGQLVNLAIELVLSIHGGLAGLLKLTVVRCYCTNGLPGLLQLNPAPEGRDQGGIGIGRRDYVAASKR